MVSDEHAEFETAKNIAFRILKIRNRTKQEIELHLKKYRTKRKIRDKVIRHLAEIGLIDDRQFIKDWVMARSHKPFGYRRIYAELIAKGINHQLAKDELAKYPLEDNDAVVLDLAKRRAARYKDRDKLKIKRRVFDYLARRGFGVESIQKAVNQI